MSAELLDKKEIFDEYVKLRKHELSAFSFSSIFLWKDFFTFDFKVIRNSLCIFAQNESGIFMYLPPLGEVCSADAVDECFRVMEKVNGGSGVTRIENVCENQVEFFAEAGFRTRAKTEEYCYLREDIACFVGGKYKSKRHDKNLFLAKNDVKFIPFESTMKKECLGLYDSWSADRASKHAKDDIYLHMLRENRIAHNISFESFKELNLCGRVAIVAGKIIAYTFGYEINSEMFCILSEVVNPRFSGAATYIFSEMCADMETNKYKLINTMDDMFLESLKDSKESFQVTKKIPSYIATRDL